VGMAIITFLPVFFLLESTIVSTCAIIENDSIKKAKEKKFFNKLKIDFLILDLITNIMPISMQVV
jgi:hypothetical protein